MKIIEVKGGCMRPIIRSGQIVFCKKVGKVRPGDIVLYKKGDRKYLHRVIKICGDKLVVGDDCGILSYHEIFVKQVEGKCFTIFNGFIGLVYHCVIRTIFIVFRKLKNKVIRFMVTK